MSDLEQLMEVLLRQKRGDAPAAPAGGGPRAAAQAQRPVAAQQAQHAQQGGAAAPHQHSHEGTQEGPAQHQAAAGDADAEVPMPLIISPFLQRWHAPEELKVLLAAQFARTPGLEQALNVRHLEHLSGLQRRDPRLAELAVLDLATITFRPLQKQALAPGGGLQLGGGGTNGSRPLSVAAPEFTPRPESVAGDAERDLISETISHIGRSFRILGAGAAYGAALAAPEVPPCVRYWSGSAQVRGRLARWSRLRCAARCCAGPTRLLVPWAHCAVRGANTSPRPAPPARRRCATCWRATSGTGCCASWTWTRTTSYSWTAAAERTRWRCCSRWWSSAAQARSAATCAAG
jgi:hypothetical protein